MNYDAIAAYAGEHLEQLLPDPINIGRGGQVPDFAVGVYVAVGLDGTVLYVGSVHRPGNQSGVQARIDEHRRQLDRLQTWDKIYVVPLVADTPLSTVRRIEGRIGAHLAPSASRALPRLAQSRPRDSAHKRPHS